MGRTVMLSNGHMLVGLNESGLVHDFYYPYVGEDNLTTSRIIHHNIGVWVNGEFSWLDSPSWKIDIDFEQDALISSITAASSSLGVELAFKDFVDVKYNAFCRQITLKNLADKPADIRLFMHQAFQISRAGRSDTALYVPSGNYLLDYKGWCSLLIYAEDSNGKGFDQYAVGNYGIEGKEGTFRDAEDGELSDNSVEHGGVDSVLRLPIHLEAGENESASYWVVASDSQFDAEIIHRVLIKEGVEKRLENARLSWARWLAIGQDKLSKIDEKYLPMARKSLLVIKSHTDRHGGIIASCDSSIYNYGRDYYSYVWPRDGALVVLPLIELGYTIEPRKFFEFCADTMHPGGYMMHKYQPDRSIGSTWHPLLHNRHPELAIQEDETAAVLFAMALYFKKNDDPKTKKELYEHFIRPAANFMSGFIDDPTNLPHASYDLWEEKFATHTYTVILTEKALKDAADIAQEYGEDELVQKWRAAAVRISSAIAALFNQEGSYYRKSLFLNKEGNLDFDNTLDISSAFSAMYFGDGGESDERLAGTIKAVEEKLFNNAPIGGVPRYEHDNYFLTRPEYLGNPWIITTLWLAQYYIKSGRRDEAIKLIDWAIARASPSGILPEQVDPVTGDPVGVAPLVWSHATLVHTLLMLYE